MLTDQFNFIVKSGRERMREMARVALPYIPQAGMGFAELEPKGFGLKREYVIKKVTFYLWPSGDTLVSDNSAVRPYGEIVLEEVKIAERDTSPAMIETPNGVKKVVKES